jgi:hypothetical protein
MRLTRLEGPKIKASRAFSKGVGLGEGHLLAAQDLQKGQCG